MTAPIVDEGSDIAVEEPTSEPAVEEGSVLGEATSTETAAGPEQATSNEAVVEPAALATPTDDTASSTADSLDVATSTGSVEPQEEPKEEPFVLQPAVTLQINGSSITAEIELENLTCKSCERVLPAAVVKAYYTPWYPNDGPDLKEVGERYAEQEINVSDVALWASRPMSWSAADVAPGRYYFVVVVDSEKAIGAYRMYRSEFAI